MAEDPSIEVLAERIAALDRFVQLSWQAQRTALEKAESAQEKRFESVNEFRSALTDQTRQFATKSEVAPLAEASQKDRNELRGQLQEMRVAMRDLVPRTESDAAVDALRAQMEYLQGAVNRLLITMLSSFVLALVTALIWDFVHSR